MPDAARRVSSDEVDDASSCQRESRLEALVQSGGPRPSVELTGETVRRPSRTGSLGLAVDCVQ